MSRLYDDEALWNEIRETKDADKLRNYLLQTEREIKAIVGEQPFDFYRNYPTGEQVEAVEDLLFERQCLLDRMFTWSKYEVDGIDRTNSRLNDLYKKMYQRSLALYRCVLAGAMDLDFDDHFNVEGWLNSDATYEINDGQVDEFDTILHLENDNHYGSHFAYMLALLKEHYLFKDDGLQYIDECHVYHKEGNTPEMTDEELSGDMDMRDDGYSWADYHRRPEIDHIVIGHPFHSMFDHHHYSLADIIRIKRFNLEVKVVCEKTTDIDGRKWEDLREELPY